MYKKSLEGVVGVCAFVLIFIIGLECDRRADNSLRLHKITVNGICTGINPKRGNWITIRYYFITRKNRYHEDGFAMRRETAGRYELDSLLIGKVFPVIYDSTRFRNSRMLIFKEDFLEFNCAIPDSLVSLVAHIDSIRHRQPFSL